MIKNVFLLNFAHELLMSFLNYNTFLFRAFPNIYVGRHPFDGVTDLDFHLQFLILIYRKDILNIKMTACPSGIKYGKLMVYQPLLYNSKAIIELINILYFRLV